MRSSSSCSRSTFISTSAMEAAGLVEPRDTAGTATPAQSRDKRGSTIMKGEAQVPRLFKRVRARHADARRLGSERARCVVVSWGSGATLVAAARFSPSIRPSWATCTTPPPTALLNRR